MYQSDRPFSGLTHGSQVLTELTSQQRACATKNPFQLHLITSIMSIGKHPVNVEYIKLRGL